MRDKNYKDGSRRNEILKMLLLCGCIPYKSLAYVKYQTEMIRRVTRKMELEGILKKFKVNGKKVLVLEKMNTIPKDIIESVDERYINYYADTGITDRHRLSTNKETEAERVIGNADAMIFFENCGSKAFLEKDAFSEITKESLKEDTYYTLREFRAVYGNIDAHKTLDVKTNQRILVNTRAAGVLFTTDDYIYPVYDISGRAIQWSKTGEMSFLQYLRRIGMEKGFNAKTDSCLVLYENTTDILPRIIEWKKRKGMTTMNVDMTFEHMYFIPQDDYGVSMAEIIYKPELREKLFNCFLTPEEMEVAKRADFRVDGYDMNTGIYKCVFCVPDMVKLKFFMDHAKYENNKEKYVVYCYDFQTQFIERELSEYCTIVPTTFEDVITKIYSKE